MSKVMFSYVEYVYFYLKKYELKGALSTWTDLTFILSYFRDKVVGAWCASTRSAYKKLTVMARTEDQRFTVSESMTIGFIGAGRMAQAMSRGFISKG